MKGFLIFLLAVVLILFGAFGLAATIFSAGFTWLTAAIQGVDISATPMVIVGVIFFVILVLGIYLKK